MSDSTDPERDPEHGDRPIEKVPDPRDPTDEDIEQLDPDAPGTSMFRDFDDDSQGATPEPNEPG